MLPKYGNSTLLLKIKKKKWKSVVFTNKIGKNSQYFGGVFNKTIIIPVALVGYEITRAIYHLVSNAHSWNSLEAKAIGCWKRILFYHDLQIMVCSCAMSSNHFWLQIIFCSYTNETTLLSFLRSLLAEIFIKKQTLWSNEKDDCWTRLSQNIEIWWQFLADQLFSSTSGFGK